MTARVTPIKRRGSRPTSRQPARRRPTKNSKELELKLFVMEVLGLQSDEVLYEQNNSFDLEICSRDGRLHGLFLERTTADKWSRIGKTGGDRARALSSLARKLAQAARFQRLRPKAKVWVVTDAEWKLMQQDPDLLRQWAGLSAQAVRRPVLAIVQPHTIPA